MALTAEQSTLNNLGATQMFNDSAGVVQQIKQVIITQGNSYRVENITPCLHPQSACSMTGGYEKIAPPEL